VASFSRAHAHVNPRQDRLWIRRTALG